jgi:diketogulonate reductase-like aldo/keto reductase
VNLIDTADVYSDGASEEIVGEVLRGRRDEVLVATKVRFSMGPGPNDAGLSRHHIVPGCEASLRPLQTDHIDLYQVYEWDGQSPLVDTLEALDLLVRAGKVRYVGVSNLAGWQLMKALGTAERTGLPSFVSQQIYYSLQARDAEYELIPAAVDQGLGVMVWSPLAGGLLSGKYRRDRSAPAGSRRLTDWDERPVYDREQLYDTVDVLVAIGEAHGVSAVTTVRPSGRTPVRPVPSLPARPAVWPWLSRRNRFVDRGRCCRKRGARGAPGQIHAARRRCASAHVRQVTRLRLNAGDVSPRAPAGHPRPRSAECRAGCRRPGRVRRGAAWLAQRMPPRGPTQLVARTRDC